MSGSENDQPDVIKGSRSNKTKPALRKPTAKPKKKTIKNQGLQQYQNQGLTD